MMSGRQRGQSEVYMYVSSLCTEFKVRRRADQAANDQARGWRATADDWCPAARRQSTENLADIQAARPVETPGRRAGSGHHAGLSHADGRAWAAFGVHGRVDSQTGRRWTLFHVRAPVESVTWSRGACRCCGAGCLCGVLVVVGVGQHQHLRWTSLQAVGCSLV